MLVNELVGRQVCRECFPVLYHQYRKEPKQTLGFFQGWGCRSLLGAMYLQMMMYMTEGSEAVRPRLPATAMAGLALATVAVFYLGILPARVLDLALASIGTIF